MIQLIQWMRMWGEPGLYCDGRDDTNRESELIVLMQISLWCGSERPRIKLSAVGASNILHPSQGSNVKFTNTISKLTLRQWDIFSTNKSFFSMLSPSFSWRTGRPGLVVVTTHERRDCIVTTNGGNKRCGALSDMQSLILTFANILKTSIASRKKKLQLFP